MMGDLISDFLADFIGSNIHQSKNLPTISGNDLRRKVFTQKHGKFAFPRSSCSSDDDGSVVVLTEELFYFSFCF